LTKVTDELPESPDLAPAVEDAVELVAEDDVAEEDVAEDAEASETAEREPSVHFVNLVTEVRAAGHDVVVLGPGDFDDDFYARIELKTPRGKSRRLLIDEGAAEQFAALDLSKIEILERYEGYHVPGEGLIECSIRNISARLLERIPALSGQRDEDGRVRLEVEHEGVRIKVASSSLTGQLLTSGRASYSVSISNIDLNGASADDVLERIVDSLFFDLDLRYGVHVALTRVRPRPVRTLARRRKSDLPPSFPMSSYPHEPMTLFRSAREMSATPIIRYWSYYQVLEFFFPRYSLEAAMRVASNIVKHPRFDPYSSDEITRLIGAITDTTGRSRNYEDRDLLSTITSLVEERELIEFITRSSLEEVLKDKSSEISDKRVILASGEPVRTSVAARVYDIRCRIVHSKADGGGGGTGLLPGTHHEDLVLQELPLVEFLAERALVASAARLDVRALSLRLG
jgi:hypothetical protein